MSKTVLELPPIPIISPPPPIIRTLYYALRLWSFKILVDVFIRVFPYFRDIPKPSYTKVYPQRPMITNRIFVPSSFQPGDKPLPLYIDIHGGGFVLCNPSVDDRVCRTFANDHGLCVVSIGYRRAPRFPFPTPVFDVAALIAAVLDDASLPADRTRVAIGGFSAGGNLALAATQLEALRGRVAAVVGFYPAVDFTKSIEQKLATRAFAPGEVDVLAESGSWFDWGYLPRGQDRRDKLLSPAFAPRDELVPKIFLMGCEKDMLCAEAEEMAVGLARFETAEKKTLSEYEWEQGRVRWRKIMGQPHGFNQMPLQGPAEVERRAQVKGAYNAVVSWLRREVYA